MRDGLSRRDIAHNKGMWVKIYHKQLANETKMKYNDVYTNGRSGDAALPAGFDHHGGILLMSFRVSRALRALTIILLALLLGASALADSIEVRLNASAKVYQSLSASARSIKAPKGLRVNLQAYEKGWGKVTYRGRTGYIRLRYLDRVKPLKAYVTTNTVVYRGASASKQLTTVSAGTVVYVLGVDGSFVRILNRGGKWKGYIKAGVLSASKPASSNAASSEAGVVPASLQATAEGAKHSKIEMTIFVAQNLVGVPYSEHPTPPRSFDCAKYAWYCYGKSQSDVLESTSRNQGYDTRYAKVSYDALKRGDLVCFDTVSDDDLTDHVGIYLGGGYFLHSSSVAKQVIVSQLNSGYYKRTFSWARRIFDK